MKFKINAGVDFETVTPAELDAAMQRFFVSWQAELTRGLKIRPFTVTAQAATNVFSVDGLTLGAGQLGPRQGFVWKVLYVAFGGPGFVKGTDAVSIFAGDASDTKIVASGITRQHTFAPLYLQGGEALSFSGAATGAAGAGVVFVAGQAVEAPVSAIQALL